MFFYFTLLIRFIQVELKGYNFEYMVLDSRYPPSRAQAF
jgi:hypothetical protein